MLFLFTSAVQWCFLHIYTRDLFGLITSFLRRPGGDAVWQPRYQTLTRHAVSLNTPCLISSCTPPRSVTIWSHCYSNNLGDYTKSHSLISTKLWEDMEQNVFWLCAKLRVCPLFEISTIDQPLFRGWGLPVRGGIVIWLAWALWALGARQHVIGLHQAIVNQ